MKTEEEEELNLKSNNLMTMRSKNGCTYVSRRRKYEHCRKKYVS